MNFKKYFFILFASILSLSVQSQNRKEIQIPDIPGYKTLKCDFHMHTVFSDGTVWPTIRVLEAWMDGLDAISITDHIEYQRHSTDVKADLNRSYEIAQPAAERSGIILIRGGEITRSMPPGHLNALFIQNANLLKKDSVMDALQEAKDQGAFILWNHPGWRRQQPDTTLWWDLHTKLYNSNLLNGIEVVNSDEYYPEALTWANEKNLTIFGNSDTHLPISMNEYLVDNHRPITLVFAKEANENSIKEALFDGRTAVYSENNLYGKEDYLEPLFKESISITRQPAQLKNKGVAPLLFTNNSDIDFELEQIKPSVGFDAPEKISLKAHHSTLVELRGNSDEVESMEKLILNYSVKNIYITPAKNLNTSLVVNNH